MSQEIIKIRLLPADALEADVDVLALKYAQANYGLDTHVSRILTDKGKDPSLMRPARQSCTDHSRATPW